MKPASQGIINSLIWIICGGIVVLIRVTILQSASILLWEALGFGMIAYGISKLLWILAKGAPTARWVP